MSKRNTVKVETAACGYFDLLGIQSRLSDCQSRKDTIRLCSQLDAALREVREHLSNYAQSYSGWSCQYFSDSVLIVLPIRSESGFGEPELGHVISELSYCQFILLSHGFPIRGGVSIGGIHVGKSVTSGAGILRAYIAEQRAEHPRVLMSPEVEEYLTIILASYEDPGQSSWANTLLRDQDTKPFINYLRIVNDGYDSNLQLLKQHREFVASGLKMHAHNPRVFKKFEWMQRYHTWFCANCLSSSDQFCPTPTLINELQVGTNTFEFQPLSPRKYEEYAPHKCRPLNQKLRVARMQLDDLP